MSSRLGIVLLVAFLVIAWFAGTDQRALTRPDEGRYSEISREMVATGDYVTPRLNGLKYFEKPPLQYWATALAYEAFGEHNWTARLWPVLSGLLGIAFACAIAYRLDGGAAAIATGAILASSLWYFAIAHISTLDMGITAWMTLTLAAFLYAQRSDATARERGIGMHVAWAAMALAMLSKGLIGIVLPGGILFVYSLWQRELRLWDRLHIGSGLLLFLAIVVPWFWLVQSRNPEFSEFFFFHEHLARFSSTTHRREGAWWYFLPILVGGFAPWTPMLATVAGPLLRALRTRKAFHPERMLVAWTAFIFLFFSASGSKLPSYIVPVFPALALLLAPRVALLSARVYAANIAVSVVFAVSCIAALTQSERFASDEVPVQLIDAMWPWLAAALACIVVGTIVAWRLRASGRTLAPVIATAAGCLLGWQLGTMGYDELSPATSSYHLVRAIEAKEGPLDRNLPFYSFRTYEQTLPFYLKRTMTLVDFYDEMALGLFQEPDKGIPTLVEFIPVWKALPAGYATMRPEGYDELRKVGLPMRELGRDTRRVIVSRR